MKKRCKAALFVLALIAAAMLVPSPSHAAVNVDVGLFYDDLAPHGDWIEMEHYGWVWTPRHVPADWRPYSRGHWVLTVDDGWLWASDEDWGWATCHYGRWFFDQTYGWVWVPGREWAPAWVSWRTGGGYIGWAPLGPEFRWNAAVGLRVGDVDLDAAIAPSRYVFVPEAHFLDAGVYRRAVPAARNVAIVSSTRNVTHYTVVNHRPVNLGVDVREVEARAHRAVPRVRVVEETSQRSVSQGSSGSSSIRVFRPDIHEAKGKTPPRTKVQASAAKPRPAEPQGAHPLEPRAAAQPDNRVASRTREEQARRETQAAAPRLESHPAPKLEGQHAQAREEQERSKRMAEQDRREQQQAQAARAHEAENARKRQEAQARENQKQQQAQAREQQKRDEQAQREQRQHQQRAEQQRQKQQEQERRRAQEQARKKPTQGADPEKS